MTPWHLSSITVPALEAEICPVRHIFRGHPSTIHPQISSTHQSQAPFSPILLHTPFLIYILVA